MDLFSFPFRFVVGRGATTRFLRLDPGSGRDEAVTQDFWTEIYIVSGGRTATQSAVYARPPHSNVPPGKPHAPFHSTSGRLNFEIRYWYPNVGTGWTSCEQSPNQSIPPTADRSEFRPSPQNRPYGRTVTLALALPPRLLFTVILPGLLLTRNLPLPVAGNVPMTAFVAVL
jgi:hypothetical protein